MFTPVDKFYFNQENLSLQLVADYRDSWVLRISDSKMLNPKQDIVYATPSKTLQTRN